MAETVAGAAHKVAHNLWIWLLIRGLLALAIGVVAVMWPVSALFAFTLLFAAYAFADGAVSLVAGFRGVDGASRGALIFRGIVGLLVGALFILMPLLVTATYAYFIVALLVAWSIITGVLEIWAAIRLRDQIEGEWLLGLSGAISLLLGLGVLVLVLPIPAVTILSAAWLIAIYAFAAGIVLVYQAIRLRKLAS
jgi:uncharacterized membrane protein HdeD (DUF308 family)